MNCSSDFLQIKDYTSDSLNIGYSRQFSKYLFIIIPTLCVILNLGVIIIFFRKKTNDKESK